MATLQSGKCFTVPTFFGMCCRSEWQERMYIYKWHEVDQTKHEIFCVHIVCNEVQVKVNLEITTFFFYLRFPYCPNFFWFGVVCIYIYIYIYIYFYIYIRIPRYWATQNYRKGNFFTATALYESLCSISVCLCGVGAGWAEGICHWSGRGLCA